MSNDRLHPTSHPKHLQWCNDIQSLHLLHHIDKFVTCSLCICYHKTTIIYAFYTKHHKTKDCNSRLHRGYPIIKLITKLLRHTALKIHRLIRIRFIKQFYGNTGYTAIFTERLDCKEKERYAPQKQLIRIFLVNKTNRCTNSSFIGITTVHISGSLSALHQKFLAVHRLWYILCSCVELFATRSRMELQAVPSYPAARNM